MNENGQLVMSRKFPTVEKRQQMLIPTNPTSQSSSQQQPNSCDLSSMSDSVLVKTYLGCLEKVISDQLTNECFLLFSLKLNQKRLRSQLQQQQTSLDNSSSMMTDEDTDLQSEMNSNSGLVDDLEQQEEVMDEFILWPFVAIVVGGVSFIALPFMDGADGKKFVEFYHSQMTDLQRKDSLVFHLTNTFRNKCVVTTHRLPFDSHQNNNDSTRAFDLIDLTSVTGALCMLQDMSSAYFLAKSQPRPQNLHQNMDPVALYMHMFLSQSMPFGRPLETSTNVHQLISRPLTHRIDGFDRKRPSWRSHEQRNIDKQRITFIIRENIESIQYDKPKIPDIWSCHGSIMCSADVAGSPDISVQLSNLSNITQFAAHRCCSQYPQVLSPTNPFTLVFSPPPGGFVLCKYNVCDESTSINSSNAQSNVSLPLRGFYQMREFVENNMDTVEVLVQLKLEKTVSNNFEYCNVYIPFPNKNSISDFKLMQSTVGQVSKSNSAHALLWKLGNKFKTKNLEVVLAAKIYFSSSNDLQTEIDSDRKKDPLLVGTNAYIKLSYKLLDHSLSGLEVDNRTISTSPASQFAQVSIKHEIISNNCMIWNSIANDVRYTV